MPSAFARCLERGGAGKRRGEGGEGGRGRVHMISSGYVSGKRAEHGTTKRSTLLHRIDQYTLKHPIDHFTLKHLIDHSTLMHPIQPR